MRSLPLGLPAALVVATILGGCGLSDPYTNQQRASTRSSKLAPGTSASSPATVTNADPRPEQGGSIPAAARASQNRLAANAGRESPRAALERYATLDINWTAKTVAGVQRELAALSVGQARAQALQAAASYGHDRVLQTSQVANSGSVIAMAPGQGAEAGAWVIVTREQTTGEGDYAGLPVTDHVTVAQVEHTATGWVVSTWSPTP